MSSSYRSGWHIRERKPAGNRKPQAVLWTTCGFLWLVARGGVEPPTFRFSGMHSWAARRALGPKMVQHVGHVGALDGQRARCLARRVGPLRVITGRHVSGAANDAATFARRAPSPSRQPGAAASRGPEDGPGPGGRLGRSLGAALDPLAEAALRVLLRRTTLDLT